MDIELDTLITLLRWLAIFLPAIYFLNRYVKFFYGFPLKRYLGWLIKPSARQPIDLGVPVFTFILFLTCIFFASFITDGFYIKAFGKQQDYVYLGNSTEFNARYYQESDSTKKVLVVLSPDIQFNYSFDDIERKQSFLHDANVTNDLGNTVSQYSVGRTVTFIFIIMMFFLPMLGTLHASFSPMCSAKFGYDDPNNIYRFDWNKSFNELLKQHHFSLAKWAMAWVLSIILMISCSNVFPRQQFGERVSPLPYMITPGNSFEATPISIHTIYATERYTTSGSTVYEDFDTNSRNVTFTFESVFSRATFVTTIVDVEDNAELEELIKSSIRSNKKMSVLVTDDLGFELVTD